MRSNDAIKIEQHLCRISSSFFFLSFVFFLLLLSFRHLMCRIGMTALYTYIYLYDGIVVYFATVVAASHQRYNNNDVHIIKMELRKLFIRRKFALLVSSMFDTHFDGSLSSLIGTQFNLCVCLFVCVCVWKSI